MWQPAELKEVAPNVERGLLTSVTLPAGLKSSTGDAVLGLNGHLFLTEGSNKVADMYQTSVSKELLNLVDAWESVLISRARTCAALEIAYVQMVVPEKLSVLGHLSIPPIAGLTTLLGALEARLSGSEYYLPCSNQLLNWTGQDDPYLTTDTHLSPAGAQRLFAALVSRIDPSLNRIVSDVAMDSVRYVEGDLSTKFHGLPLYSRVEGPASKTFDSYRTALQMVERFFPGTKHIGRRFRWVNPSSPSPLKVLVFGNSFFSVGDQAGLLSWWGKHLFREFHFIWDPAFDWEVVKSLEPDVVIGQTVERFLPTVPAN